MVLLYIIREAEREVRLVMSAIAEAFLGRLW